MGKTYTRNTAVVEHTDVKEFTDLFLRLRSKQSMKMYYLNELYFLYDEIKADPMTVTTVLHRLVTSERLVLHGIAKITVFK